VLGWEVVRSAAKELEQTGEVRFEAIGTYYPEITVTDEAGCEDESRARVAGAEKHGYTAWSNFEWPDQ